MLQFDGGFGSINWETFNELKKALEVGHDIPPYTGGGALRVQDLEGTLKWATFRDEHAKLWRRMPRKPAISTVVEYTRVTGLGAAGSGFLAELGDLAESTGIYERVYEKVKFIGVRHAVSRAALAAQVIGGPDAMAVETRVAMVELVKRIERALFFGNDSLDSDQWRGLFQQIEDYAAATNNNDLIVDLRGQPLTKEVLEDVAQRIMDNYGQVTHVFMGVRVKTDLRKTVSPGARYPEGYAGPIHLHVDRFITEGIDGMADNAELVAHILLRHGGDPKAQADAGAPARPTSVTMATVSDANSRLDAGTYAYKVSAVGANGESLPTQAATGGGDNTITVSAGQSVQLTIVNGDANNTKYYRIYRASSVGSEKLLAEVPAEAGGADTVWTDDGTYIEGTAKAVALTWQSDDEIYFRQLLPVMRIDLPPTLMALPFGILLFGTPIVATPNKCVVIRNIGKLE